MVTAEPDYIRNAAGEVIGVDAWVQLFDAHGVEIPVDPHRRVINPPTITRDGVDDPTAAFLEAVWDSVAETPNPAGWRTRGTVTTIYASLDGRLDSQGGSTYSTARQGTGTIQSTTTTATTAVGQYRAATYSCYEQFFSFDTSALPDDDEVLAVELALYMVSVTGTSFTVEVREYDWGPSLSSSDWVPGSQLGNYTLLATLDTATMGSSGSYKTFTSTSAFLTATGMKTGPVRMVTSSSRHRAGTQPSTSEYVQFAMSATSGTSQDPRLTITHQAQTPGGGDGQVTFIGLVAGVPSDPHPGEPAGAREGDIALVVTQASTPPSATAGWTKVLADRTGQGWTGQVWYAVRGSTPLDITWLLDTYYDVAYYRGARPVPHATAQSTNASATVPSVTTTVPDVMLVCLYADATTSTSAPPAGMTKRSNSYNCVGDAVVTTPGATGSRTFQSVADPIGAWSVALAPAPAGGEEHSGGSTATVTVSASGGGAPVMRGGQTAPVTVSAVGGGAPTVDGGSTAAVAVTATGGGLLRYDRADQAVLAEHAGLQIPAAEAATLTDSAHAEEVLGPVAGDVAALGEAATVAAAVTVTDQAVLDEHAEVGPGSGDTATVTDSAGIEIPLIEQVTFAEAATITVLIDTADAATLADSGTAGQPKTVTEQVTFGESVTVTTLTPGLRMAAGLPFTGWAAESPHTGWSPGRPHSEWAASGPYL